VQFPSAERDGAEGEVLPGGAVLIEGLHAPGGVAASRAYVQGSEGTGVSFSPLTDIQKVKLLGGHSSSGRSESYAAADSHDRGLPQGTGGQRVYVGPVSLEADS
jgi:hypothetical protein